MKTVKKFNYKGYEVEIVQTKLGLYLAVVDETAWIFSDQNTISLAEQEVINYIDNMDKNK